MYRFTDRHRESLSFRSLKFLLWFDWRFIAILVGCLVTPIILLDDFTVKFGVFILAALAITWVANVPSYGRRDDGSEYKLDAQERAEWVIDNARFPRL